MVRWTSAVGAIAFVLVLSGITAARAQPAGGDREKDAERLFVEGRTAASAGDYTSACARFTESLALVERPGTLLNLADCDERGGKPLAASRRVERALTLLDPGDPRQTFAQNRLSALQRRVPSLRIVLGAAVDPAARIGLDGAALGGEALRGPLSVEPGRHRVTVDEADRPQRTVEVDVPEGGEKKVEIGAEPAPEATPPVEADEPTDHVPAFVVGGIGLAGFAVAGVTGVLLLSRDGDIDDACPSKQCSAEGRELIDGQGPLFVANAVGFGVGVVGVGLGAVLFFTASGDTPEAALDVTVLPLPGGAGATVRGAL